MVLNGFRELNTNLSLHKQSLKALLQTQNLSNASADVVVLRQWHEQKYQAILYLDSKGNMMLFPIEFDSTAVRYICRKSVTIAGETINFDNNVDSNGNGYLNIYPPVWSGSMTLLVG